MSEWIACKDRMPDKHVGVLVTNGEIVTAAQWSPIELPKVDPRGSSLPWWDGHEHSAHDWEWHFDQNTITHWMPLPSPPDQASVGDRCSMRAALGNVLEEVHGVTPIPTRLELGVTPRSVCNRYDVYFDGVKQRLCTIADVQKGFIKRYVCGVGHKPVPNKSGMFDMEMLFGRVQIVLRGARPSEQKEREAIAAGSDANGAAESTCGRVERTSGDASA